MSYQPRSLFKLIEQIEQSALLLPHIQRPFVWEEDQMLKLFDSVMRNYPIQTLLFWRTKQEIRCRRFMSEITPDPDLHKLYANEKSADGVEKVLVLDGQQRLQTLYSIFNGGFRNGSIREAWFDVTSGEPRPNSDLHYALQFCAINPGSEILAEYLGSNPAACFYRVRDLRQKDSSKSAEEIAESLNDGLDAAFADEDAPSRKERQKRVRKNVGRLVSILREEIHFWALELDGVAKTITYSEVLDIFVRVNSGGTKLEPADLMFAAMKKSWDEVEQNIEEIAALLNGANLDFDKHFVLKCLTVAHDAGATVTPEKLNSAKPTASGRPLIESIEADWDRAQAAFEELRDFVANDLKVYHPKVVSTYLSFIPLFDYLYQNPKPTPENRKRMMAFYYSAHFFKWFSASGDSRLDKIHGIIKGGGKEFPLQLLRDGMASSYGVDIVFEAKHLAASRSRSALLNLLYAQTHGTSPFNVASKSNEPHIDHIYPKSQLAKLRDVAGEPLSSEEINHLGNFRYVGASDNGRKRAELPAPYFSRLAANSIAIKPHLLVDEFSAAPSRLIFDLDTYRSFRDQRTKLILDQVCSVVNHAV